MIEDGLGNYSCRNPDDINKNRLRPKVLRTRATLLLVEKRANLYRFENGSLQPHARHL